MLSPLNSIRILLNCKMLNTCWLPVALQALVANVTEYICSLAHQLTSPFHMSVCPE